MKIFYLKTPFKHTLKKENCTITFVILIFNSELTNKIVSILKKYLNFIVLKTLKNILWLHKVLINGVYKYSEEIYLLKISLIWIFLKINSLILYQKCSNILSNIFGSFSLYINPISPGEISVVKSLETEPNCWKIWIWNSNFN